MAEYIETEAATVPATAGTLIRSDEWGIDNLLANYIVQSENITESRITDVTQDQKGAVVSELDYDSRYDLSLTVIGDGSGIGTTISPGDTTFSYGGNIWKLISCSYTGSYNGKKTYSISGYRYRNFPAQA